ncbi:MAG: hypothetical protein NT106_04365 [Candidatus Sumerlaeota bacterium]|nr:hypothetical protein [Candidatus Sumerlaeota bacterium]
MRSSGATGIGAAFFEVMAAVGYFCALAVLLVVWQPGRYGWGFFVHVLMAVAFAGTLFAPHLSGRRIRAPLSAPEILLFLIFAYLIFNTAHSQIPVAVLERFPFVLDGLFAFYIGAVIFSRRHEAVIPLFFLFIIGVYILSLHYGNSDIWMPPGDAPALYRGEKMSAAVFADYPIWGCGYGVLPQLVFKYLIMPDRYPPVFRNSYALLLAEMGSVGIILCLGFLGAMVIIIKRKREKVLAGGKKVRAWFFYAAVLLLLFLLAGGLASPVMAAPAGIVIFLPICGMLTGMTGGDEVSDTAPLRRQSYGASATAGQRRLNRTGRPFFIGVSTILALILLLEAVPLISERLAHYGNIAEIGTTTYGRRLNLASRLMPCNAEYHRRYAQHLRALCSVAKDMERRRPPTKTMALALLIDLAYHRALRWNPYSVGIYMEYGHFLDLTHDRKGLVSLMERAKKNCPGSLEVRLFLCRGYIDLGQRKAALDELDDLRAFYPLDYPTHLRIGRYYADLGARGASQYSYLLAEQALRPPP